MAERIRSEHLTDICRLHSDTEVMKTLSADGNILSDEVTQKGLEKATQHWDQNGFGLWIFRAKKDGAFIGRGGLLKYQIESVEVIGLAYAVISDFWGKGYATEMSDVSLQIGFDFIGAKDISTWTLPINERSRRVLKKVGFKYERDFVFAGLSHQYYRVTENQFQPRTTIHWS